MALRRACAPSSITVKVFVYKNQNTHPILTQYHPLFKYCYRISKLKYLVCMQLIRLHSASTPLYQPRLSLPISPPLLNDTEDTKVCISTTIAAPSKHSCPFKIVYIRDEKPTTTTECLLNQQKMMMGCFKKKKTVIISSIWFGKLRINFFFTPWCTS